jgi:hypothetical protein
MDEQSIAGDMVIKGVHGFTLSQGCYENEEDTLGRRVGGGRHHIRHLKLQVDRTIPR